MEKIKFLKDCILFNVSVGLVLGVGGSLEDHLPKDEDGATKHYGGGETKSELADLYVCK